MIKTVSLSFDFEECDLPREHGVDFPIEEGMKLSAEGAAAVLGVLERQGVKATFFCTLNFAERAPEIMRRIVAGGHEVAAHGVDHFRQVPEDPFLCKAGLERLLPGVRVVGYRQPRMFPVDNAALAKAGYRYNSSLNPAFIPGRYMHLDVPRTRFVKDGLLQIPTSVTPWIRFPLFWLALHVLPQPLYAALVRRTLNHDGFFMTYFHPWEFSSLSERAAELKVPRFIRLNLGKPMAARLEKLIIALKEGGAEFRPIVETLDMKFNTESQRHREG